MKKYKPFLITKENQRYYKLDFKVKNVSVNGRKSTIKKIFEADPIKLVEKYELAEDVSESIDKICVSDAHSHHERLVFPVFRVRNKETGEISHAHRCNNIEGYQTMMIHGGDYTSMKEDNVYIRKLRMLNKKEQDASQIQVEDMECGM